MAELQVCGPRGPTLQPLEVNTLTYTQNLCTAFRIARIDSLKQVLGSVS